MGGGRCRLAGLQDNGLFGYREMGFVQGAPLRALQDTRFDCGIAMQHEGVVILRSPGLEDQVKTDI